jgi:cold shock CspA family protein
VAPSKPPRGSRADGSFSYFRAEDGHEVYFQKSSVLKGTFDRLKVGSVVSFAEEAGDKGPQASTVRLVHPKRARRASTRASTRATRRRRR